MGDGACMATPRADGVAGDSGEAGAGAWGNAVGGRAGNAAVVNTDNALRVRVEDIAGMTIEIVTLACAGDCADIEAVAHGGNPPYAFAWDDGSTDAARQVCPGATSELSVRATDTAIAAGEFRYEAHTASAQVTARVLDCSDGGTPPADGGAGPCGSEAAGVALPEDLMPDIFGAPAYFAGGAPLPAGRYRAAYVDGCMKYDASWTWTVQGAPNFQFVLIGASTANVLAVLPGTEAPIGFGITGYLDYDECVAANRALLALDFEFAGGQLGIWQNDFKPEDNIAGAKSPMWRLSQPDRCP